MKNSKILTSIFISLFSLSIVLSVYVIALGIEATVRLQGTGHVIDSYWNTARAVMTFVMFSVIILASVAGIAFCCGVLNSKCCQRKRREKRRERENNRRRDGKNAILQF